MTATNKKPLWHGIVLVVGGAVGAGMFALPMVSAGAWALWSVLGLVLVWWLTYLAGKTLLDTNLAVINELSQDRSGVVHGPAKSFDTLVKMVLGPRWAWFNNISLVFIMMILMYAYISAGASILSLTIEQIGFASQGIDRRWLSLVFSIAIAVMVWLGTAVVARISTALMMVMGLSLLAVSAELISHVKLDHLFIVRLDYLGFTWAVFPVFVTAFACAGLVPSLVRHYHGNRHSVLQCLFWGTFVALLIYILWLILTFGSLGRNEFVSVASAGGNTGDLVSALSALSKPHSQGVRIDDLSLRLSWFSHCAIVTSFLSIGLGLFHFVQDKMSWTHSLIDRARAVTCCFLPPTLASFINPKGFVVAIGYAGLLVTFSFFVVPAVMALKRKKRVQSRLSNRVVWLVMCAGCVIAVLKICLVFDWLPTWLQL